MLGGKCREVNSTVQLRAKAYAGRVYREKVIPFSGLEQGFSSLQQEWEGGGRIGKVEGPRGMCVSLKP